MDEIKDGAEAKLILEHRLVKAALDGFRKGIEAQRAKCPIKDTDLAVRLVMLEQVFNGFEHAFKQTIETGQLAEIKLREESRFRIFQR